MCDSLLFKYIPSYLTFSTDLKGISFIWYGNVLVVLCVVTCKMLHLDMLKSICHTCVHAILKSR